MAFLDNSGDIILDAVLTDTGRARLARGDGSFKITKFAMGDDEIDYASFDANNASGSAYYDLEILQTPIFEAFTNNASSMKSKLVSLTNNNLLYLPVIKLNKGDVGTAETMFAPTAAGNTYGGNTHILLVDNDTVTAVGTNATKGFINGTGMDGTRKIRTDQGLDTNEISPSLTLDPELKETQYILEIDSRFAKPYDVAGGDATPANPSFIDDDSLASYYFTENTGDYVVQSTTGPTSGNNTGPAKNNNESILGPRGTTFRFSLLAATDLVSSDYLFTNIGSTLSDGTNTFYYIDSTLRVTGVTTGYKIDIPVRFLKVQ